jgi:hypothetical protein
MRISLYVIALLFSVNTLCGQASKGLPLIDILKICIPAKDGQKPTQRWELKEDLSAEARVQWKTSVQANDPSQLRERGKILIHYLENHTDKWTIDLYGSTNAVRRIRLRPSSPKTYSIAVAEVLKKNQVEAEFIKCAENPASFGFESWRLDIPHKKTAWLTFEYSCGSGGCSNTLNLYLEDDQAIQDWNCP